MLAFLLGCAAPEPPPAAPPVPPACAAAFVPAPGPLAAEAAATRDPTALAHVRLREARLTGDPGFYVYAEQAVACGLDQRPDDPELVALKGHVLVQYHRFREAEALLAPLAARTHDPHHLLYLGDARVDLGDLDGAEAAWTEALGIRPSLEVYDRLADLAWLRGDLAGATELEELAFSAASPADPEPMAWVAARLGWYRALAGEVPNELGLALRVLPEHKPANLLLGRYLLGSRPDLARKHLETVGETVEALRLLRELDPTVDVARARHQDRRGWALVLAETDPEAAVALLDQELAQRRDATTRIDRAWAAHRAGAEPPDALAAEVRDALATGISDPDVLLLAWEVTGDPAVRDRLSKFESLFLPSWRTRLEAAPMARRNVAPR